MEAVEVARTLNLCIGSVLMYACCLRIARDWPLWGRRERVVRVHLVAYLFVVSLGSALILADVSPEARVFLLLGVHLSFAAALWRNRRDPVH